MHSFDTSSLIVIWRQNSNGALAYLENLDQLVSQWELQDMSSCIQDDFHSVS